MSDEQPVSDQGQVQQPLQELAQEVLAKEKAAPGSQDPEFVRWANDKLKGVTTPLPTSGSSIVPAQPPAPQLSQPAAAPPLSEGTEEALQIQHTPGETIQPTVPVPANPPDSTQATIPIKKNGEQ